MGAGGKRRGRVLQRAFGAILFAGFGLCVPASGGAEEFIDETRPVDVMSGGELPEYEARGPLAISEDGRYITFQSASRALTDDDYPVSPYGAPIWHLFRRDMATNEVELVDVNRAGRVARIGAPIGGAMSADGNDVIFRAPGSELGPEPLPDEIYVRDMTTGELELVNRADGTDGRIISAVGGAVDISGDGTEVTFLSNEADIDPDVDFPPDPDAYHVYVRDLAAGTTEIVDCVGADPCVPSPEGVINDSAEISADGRYILFHRHDPAGASCIDRPELPYACAQFYVRDRTGRTTTLVSRADGAGGEPANSWASVAHISGDGRNVAFDTAATNLEPGLPANDAYLSRQWTYVRDLDATTTTLAARADGLGGFPAATGSMAMGISADGEDVIITSADDSLAGFPVDAGIEGFVRHLAAGRTEMVTRRDGGFGLPSDTSPDGTTSGWAEISAAGKFSVFSSSDPRLTGVPGSEVSHVFRRQITGVPAPPEVGEKVELAPRDGTVEVKIPDSPYFEQLERGTQVPVGSRIDANDGALEIFSEDPDPAQPLRHMVWSDGEFVTDQAAGGEQLSEAILSGPLLDCDKPNRLSPKDLKQYGGHPPEDVPIPGRKVWGKGGKGHKSKGGKSSASVRGTEWLVWDTCDSKTVTYVVDGRVEVEDFDRGRTVFVDPGELYVAPGPPDTAITQGPSGTILNSTPSFWFSAGEPWDTFECRMDEGTWASCSSPTTSNELSRGEHTFSVRATDDAGSVGITPVVRSFRVDRAATAQPIPEGFVPSVNLDSVPPRTKIVAGPRNRVDTGARAANVRFRFSADEEDVSYRCRLDGADWKRCSSPKNYRLRRGGHRFAVRAIDATGNVDPTPARDSFRIVRRG